MNAPAGPVSTGLSAMSADPATNNKRDNRRAENAGQRFVDIG